MAIFLHSSHDCASDLCSHLLRGERHEDSHAWFSIMILEVAFCALPSEREVNKVNKVNKRINWETSLGVQWLRLHLPM